MKADDDSATGEVRLLNGVSFGRAFGAGHVVFQRFRLIRELGRGGAGIVFAAYDDVLEVEVALKVLHDYLSLQTGTLSTLKNEVRQSRRLIHANIVAVFEVHQDSPATSVAVAMEWVRGVSMAVARALQRSERVGR